MVLSGHNPSVLADTSLDKGGTVNELRPQQTSGTAPLAKGGMKGGIEHITKEDIEARGLICNGHHLPYNPNNISKAKELRKTMTKTERKLWYDWFAYQSYKVCRQQPIDHYIVDFYVASVRLVIEIDGDSHYTDDAIEYDIYRTDVLNIYGLYVMRFTNSEVLNNVESV